MKISTFLSTLAASLLLAGCNLEYGNGSTSSDLSGVANQAAAAAPASSSNSSSSSSSSSGNSSSSSNKPAVTSSSSSGGSGSGPAGGFLWKPVSESNGNLVVLLPPSFAGVGSITVSGAVSESSSRSAIANGGRPHYRFSRPGAAFGNNVRVTGGGRTWTVANGSRRTEL